MALIRHEFSPKPSTKTRAVSELILAGFFWGFGFIATVWTLRFLAPSAIIFYRFAMAFAVGIVPVIWRNPSKSWLLNELWLSLGPGFLLWLTLILQTWGLQYTTAINSAFITTLYVILVPLFRVLKKEEKFHWYHGLCVLIAVFGTALIVQIQKASALNLGDLLTLICAVFAAFHILAVGRQTLKTKDDFSFNIFQSFWIAFFALLSLPFSKGWDLSALDREAWVGLVTLGLGSSLIAFFLQIRAQKVLSPSVASLLFLLESPLSFFFAFLFLGESLNGWQWLGAVLILLSCGLITLSKSTEGHYA